METWQASIPTNEERATMEVSAGWQELFQGGKDPLPPSAGSLCVQELFEMQVEQAPDAVAAVFQDRHLTYGDLNRRANQVAHTLRERGVQPKTRVGIGVEPSLELIVGSLGILKAGGTCLPIDIRSSADGILSALNDSRVSLLLTRDTVVRNIPFTWLQGLRPVEQGLVITGSRPQINDLDALPFPDRSLVDYSKYDRYLGDGALKKCISIIATRGCPYTCAYCHKIWPKAHVVRSAPNIFEEVLLHYERGYRSFKIMDDVFNLNRRNSEAFFELILKNRLEIRLSFSNGLRGDILTPSYIDLMVEAGVMDLVVALETASPRLQRLIGKNLNIDKLRENLIYLCDKYPQVITSLCTMIGFPTETEEEALMTLDFIKDMKWLHFALISAVRIFPNTTMARLALQHGVSEEAIDKSTSLAYHQPGATLPFSKSFVREYQYNYLSEYFLLPERLASIIPAEKKVLTRDEFASKYNDYLPGGLENYPDIVRLIGDDGFRPEDSAPIVETPAPSRRAVRAAPVTGTRPDTDGRLRLLLIDLSQHFTRDAPPFSNLVEAPIGLMYLMTYLNREFGDKIRGKIVKSMIDFDSHEELGKLLDDFQPQLIGIRTLSLYKDFFHETVSRIKQRYPRVSIITGGPYATSEYATILADGSVDLAVLGEGELTFAELVKAMLANGGKLPGDDVLGGIVGLAFVSKPRRTSDADAARQLLLVDSIERGTDEASTRDPEKLNQLADPAGVICPSKATGDSRGVEASHADVIRWVKTMHARHQVDRRDVWALSDSSAFSVWELWGPLLCGGRLVVVPAELSQSPEALGGMLIQERVTILNASPSTFRDLHWAAASPAWEPALRLVVSGDAALDLQTDRQAGRQPPWVKTDGRIEPPAHVKTKNVEAVFPLSPVQQSALSYGADTPQTGMHLGQVRLGIHGPLDAAAWRKAWQRVVDRHAALRTVFSWERVDEPLQIVRRHVNPHWQERDWRGLPEGERQAKLDSFLRVERNRTIHLTRAPLLRLSLIRLTDETWQFTWSSPPLLWDGWSRDRVLKEVFAFYEAFVRARDLDLEPPPPYGDYVAWLQQQDSAKAEVFWRQALKGFTAPTFPRLGHMRALSGAHPKGAEEEYARQIIKLSAPTTAALQALAERQELALQTLVQGAWALLLSRYNGEQDVVFGTVASGRPAALPGAECMVGLLANILPARVQVPPDGLLLPWLKSLHAEQAELQEHGYSSLAQVQEWSQVPCGTPLFESVIIFEDSPAAASAPTRLGDLEIRDRSFFERTHYPLTVRALPGPELSLQITHDGRRFDRETIGRALGHLGTLLEGMTIDPSRRLAALPLLTETERRQILVEWNHTRRDHSLDRCAHQIFEAQAEQTPEAVALVCGEECLTYRELNRRANCLARHLLDDGVGPDILVGVLADRGIEFMIALLGILKAGGAYLPLDTHYPPKRLAQVLLQSSSPVVLTTDACMPVLAEALTDMPSGSRPGVFYVEELCTRVTTADELPPSCLCVPGHLAYIMFTSGSTGTPKGVMVEHRGMLNHLYAKIHDLGLTDSDSVAQTGSQGFDIFIWQCLAALLMGGRVHIFRDEIACDPARLLDQIECSGVTIVQLVPSMVRALAQEAEALGANRPSLRALRWMVPTGEALPTELCREWLLLYPNIPLLNTYGSTECSDDQCHDVIEQPPPSDDPLPIASIGSPIANMQVYVLDHILAPVPVGVLGELYIGGIGVGRGYLGDPQRTAETFIPDPFGPVPGARLYRTRDQVRYLPDGRLEFIGRNDHLLKIHGFRIEPGEIEAVLKQHPAVRQVVVLAREDAPGSKYLAAYVVPDVEQQNRVESRSTPEVIPELRRFAQTRLPDYMVPAAFVLLQALPLTPNGKIDRRALPAPDGLPAERGANFAAPRTPMEKVLAGIWAKALGVAQVGVHDNFFSLGGSSILSIQIIERARAAGLKLTPRQIFVHQTIAELAEVAGPP